MITYYQANRILDRQFGSTAFTVPSTLYFGLSTTTINADGTGATEPSGGSYARVAVTNNKTNFTTAASAVLSNDTDITFVESTGNWGTVTYVFIADAASAGNILFYDVLNPARAVATATTVMFAAGNLQISMTN